MDDGAYDRVIEQAECDGWSEFIQTESDRQAIRDGYIYDEMRAQRVIRFIETFTSHSKGRWAGRPFKLLDWQKNRLIRPLYGWVHSKTRIRRFRRAFVTMAKKNGKSAISSAIALYHLVADGERGPDICCVASTRDQADLVYSVSSQMVEASRSLRNLITTNDSRKFMYLKNRQKPGKLRVLSGDAGSAEGVDASLIVFDEVHIQPNKRLWASLRYSGAARAQPLFLAITTAGADRETLWGEQYERACGILDGSIVDVHTFAFVAQVPVNVDFTDDSLWHLANPSLGITVQIDELLDAYNEAKLSVVDLSRFKRYRLNIPEDANAETGIELAKWDECNSDVDDSVLADRPCYGGIDLGMVGSLSALVLVFPLGNRQVAIRSFFWLPELSCSEGHSPYYERYAEWRNQGFLRTTFGEVTDYDQIRRDITGFMPRDVQISSLNEPIVNRYPYLRELGVDPWNAAQLAQQLTGDGFSVVDVRQGFASMTEPIRTIDILYKSGKLLHAGNPIIRWHASNASLKTDGAGNYMFSKIQRHPIDGMSALATAMSVYIRHKGDHETVYSDVDARPDGFIRL